MRITLTLHEHNPQERAVLHQLQALARAHTRPSQSPFPFSWLEQGVAAALAGIERLVGCLVCALIHE